MIRKIDKMHQLFGVKDGQKCKDCMHLTDPVNGYKKCEIYGHSASEATDWARSWMACGLWNKEYKCDIPIVRLNRGWKQRKEEEQISGQMSLF